MDLVVRLMELDEVDIRIEYFHQSSSQHLEQLGIDRSCLPDRGAWMDSYRKDYVLPIEERQGILLLWLGDGEPIGFSSVDEIEYGQRANMHLHVLEDENRNNGLGTECVKQSSSLYFELLKLKYLYCQPNSFNTAPNRTLQKAGFKFVQTYETKPSSLNFYQSVNQWVLEKDQIIR